MVNTSAIFLTHTNATLYAVLSSNVSSSIIQFSMKANELMFRHVYPFLAAEQKALQACMMTSSRCLTASSWIWEYGNIWGWDFDGYNCSHCHCV